MKLVPGTSPTFYKTMRQAVVKIKTLIVIWARWESNPHNLLWSKDFKSFVSAIPPLAQGHLSGHCSFVAYIH